MQLLGVLEAARALVHSLQALPIELERRGFKVNQDGIKRSAHDLMRYPDISFDNLASIWPELADIERDIAEQVEIDARYAGYIQRQEADIQAFRRDENLKLPKDLDYSRVGSLSNEMQLKLRQHAEELDRERRHNGTLFALVRQRDRQLAAVRAELQQLRDILADAPSITEPGGFAG